MTERNGHLYPEADTAPRPAGRAVRHRSAGARKHRRAPASTGRAWSQRGPGGPGDDESAADDAPTTL